jgi:VWFA-related protein
VNALFVLPALVMGVLRPPLELQQPAPTFRSGVDVVRLDVSVVDRNGTPVRGLTAADFIVTDRGSRQEVQSVAVDRLPLSVQLVLDVSESVSGRRLERLIAAANGLLTALRPGDRAGLVTFSHMLLVPVEMTADLAAVRSALGGMTGSGRTALRDAVQLALAKTDDSESRRLVLVFTDGIDNASWLSEKATVESASRAGVVIHVVRVTARDEEYERAFGVWDRGASTKLVEELTETAGGRVWSAASEDDLERLFTRALDEMRARYVLTFTPPRPVRPGWHELKVRLRRGGGEITARRGYFVVAP